LAVRPQDIPPPPSEDPELRHLEARRQVLYENLKDLQFEYHQGKLSEEDYQSLKQGFLYDLAGVMDSIERRRQLVQKASPQSGKPGRPSKAKLPGSASAEAQACPKCKSPNPPGNRFCGRCGALLS
ncbi:MAG TPA: zinc ribbon domain-containing protein, partial [Terriglobia bacterium]|nr:zinc ribbon domain-containing protein [Terriglobia bacterium]